MHRTAVMVIVLAAWIVHASAHPAVAAAQANVALNGIVRDAATMRVIQGVRVLVTSGPDAGTFAVSDDRGAFTFPRLSAGIVDLEGTKDGYAAARIQSLALDQDAAIELPMSRAPAAAD